MVRNVENLVKIEHPKKVSEMKLDTLEIFPLIPKLGLTDIEPYKESGLPVHVDLDLDQLEKEE
jgi:hypothetical protein